MPFDELLNQSIVIIENKKNNLSLIKKTKLNKKIL
jgi:hypothetical protein